MTSLAVVVVCAAAPRERLFDENWRFHRGDAPSSTCNPTVDFPADLKDTRCMGLSRVTAADASAEACAQACCDAGTSCVTWQWCGNITAGTDCGSLNRGKPSCWIGAQNDCHIGKGWTSRGRLPTPGPSACASPFCQGSFDDSSWRTVHVPHDWSIEALPSRAHDSTIGVPQAVSGRDGTWKFNWADDAAFAASDYDDTSWASVSVPADWRTYPGGGGANGSYAVGWFRRVVSLDATQQAAAARGELFLALGTVVDGYQLYLDGQPVGSSDSVATAPSGAPHGGLTDGMDRANRSHVAATTGVSCEAALAYRRAAFASSPGARVSVALRVTSSRGASRAGGLYDTSAPDGRVGAYDAATSDGQKQTGYAVGGVGWYRKAFDVMHDLAGADASTAAAILSGGVRVILTFDGVYMLSTMWLNGHGLGTHPYGCGSATRLQPSR